MINNFPRIHGLSTLGIIYHFNTDYKFHPLRTDFSGEGGSGKTMVADMIQLILVGPGVYKSATEGNDERPLEGLVLQPKNKQYGAGYIILNIETSLNQFVAIGCFIEKSSKQIKMFIAQAGFDWENQITPLTKPLYYKNLLVNNKIVPIQELQDKLDNINIKALPLKQYHRLLYDNSILPLDLSENIRTLKSYARIFRSFSRGSGFKTDSDSIKKFLFGDDDRVLLNQYNSEVKAISDDYQEHDRYKKEIELINRKQGYIKEIMTLYNASKYLHETYHTNKVLYWYGLQTRLQEKFDLLEKNYHTSCIERLCINIKEMEFKSFDVKNQILKYRNSQKTLIDIQDKKGTLETQKELKYSKLLEIEPQKSNIEKVSKWIIENGNSLEGLKERYKKEQSYDEDKTLLEYFIHYLNIQGIKNDFEGSNWLSNFKHTEENYETELELAKQKQAELSALIVFADLQNPNSLASWAIKHFKRPLSHEEESALVYFQVLPNKANEKPMVKDRYLNLPMELFENLDIKDKTEFGFWLNLDGVYEFIEYVPTRYLNIDEKEKQKTIASLGKVKNNISKEYNELTQKINHSESLKQSLFDFSNLELAVSLYMNQQNYTTPSITEYLIDEEQFNICLTDYENKEIINKEYSIAKKDHEELVKQEGNIDPNNSEKDFKDALEYLESENINLDDIDQYMDSLAKDITQQREQLSSLQAELSMSEKEVAQIEESILEGKKNRSPVLQLKALHAEKHAQSEISYQNALHGLNQTKKQSDDAQRTYQTIFRKAFPFNNEHTPVENDPDIGEESLKTQYERSQMKFEQKYNLITDEMEDGEQLKDTFHIGQLAHKLLPTVFVSPLSIDENQVNEQLAKRLENLYQIIREIGSRKIEVLKRVFTEVSKTFRDYLDRVNKINNYFKNPNKLITGGNKGSLTFALSTDYPSKWMTVFTRILSDQLTNTGLFAELAKEIDINEMMKKAFINEGGTKNAEIEDLLNPKSYFDLKFDLRLESGDPNAGSNSQTYSGNALLGLARLSLIEDSKRKGIRIMPIDEAQGLGSNYEMLRNIAVEEGYQILSMSIDTAGEIREGEQYIYILSENKLLDEDNYVPAMGIFSDNIVTSNIEEFIYPDDN